MKDKSDLKKSILGATRKKEENHTEKKTNTKMSDGVQASHSDAYHTWKKWVE